MTASPQTSTPGSVDSTDGSTIVYRDFGGRGPVLVLLPGWACVQAMWEPVVPFLRDEFRVVSLDFPGFGRSTAGDRGWTMQEFAEDVRTIVEHLDLGNVSLVGHSMGGAVALEAARLCGDRVVAVIGCDSFTYPEVYKRVDETVIATARTAYGADFAGAVRAGIAAYLLDGGDSVLATHVADVMADADPKYAVPAMEHLLRWDVDQGLAGCPVPVASVNARRFLRAEAEREYEGRIRIETVDDVGHFLMMERPEAFAEALRTIIDSMQTAREERP